VIASLEPARVWIRQHGLASRVGTGSIRGRWLSLAIALMLTTTFLSGCAPHHGPLTNLGSVDEYPVGRWAPTVDANQVRIHLGVYPLPTYHLILVHIQIPDNALSSLGPVAVHGAVGVWWVALDDRVPGDSQRPTWLASCVRFQTVSSAFDIAGSYLSGPATASLSRYPLSFNPEDSSVSVALSPEDEISVPRRAANQAGPYLAPHVDAAACALPS
jgi:hypothetical protein